MSAAPPFPLSNRLRILLYLLVLAAVAAFAHTDEDVMPVAVALIAVIAAWLLVDSPHAQVRGQALLAALTGGDGTRPDGAAAPARPFLGALLRHTPRIVLNAIVLIAALRVAWRVYLYLNGAQSLIIGLCGFLVVLALCKLFESKTPRNVVQIVILSLLLVVASTMFSASGLSYFLILAVYFLLLCYMMVLLNLFLETQRLAEAVLPMPAPASPLSAAAKPRSPGRALFIDLLARDLANVAKHCTFLVLPVAIVVFLLVPRSNANPLLNGSWGAGVLQTGFSDGVQFRDYGQLTQSDTPVMRVKLYRDGADVTEEFTDLYFRGQVLSDYDEARKAWSHGRPTTTAPAPARPPADFDGVYVNYTLLHPSSFLFILSPSIGFDPEDQLSYNPDDMTLQDSFALTRNRDSFTYAAVWDREISVPGDISPYVPMGQLRPPRDIHTPDGIRHQDAVLVRPELAAKARAILQASMGDAAPPAGQDIPLNQIRTVVNVFTSYLRLNYRYSLIIPPQTDPKLDPTTDFLLHRGIQENDTGGYCEYFASALVMLCRSVGLNARMVTGYHGGAFDPISDELIIREKDAHAWAEVYIPDQGWVLSDPSPIGSVGDAAAVSGHFFSDLLALVKSLWSSVIVNFDNESRTAIAAWLYRQIGGALDGWNVSAWGTAGMWIALFLLLALWIHLRRRSRRRRPLMESARGLPHRKIRISSQVNFLEDMLGLFQRSSDRRPDQTPLEFLQPHLGALGPAQADARWLIQTAYGIRFGNTALNPALREQIARALKHVKSAARAAPPHSPATAH